MVKPRVDIEEFKIQVMSTCRKFRDILPCDEKDLKGEDWESFSNELKALVSEATKFTSNLIGFAGETILIRSEQGQSKREEMNNG